MEVCKLGITSLGCPQQDSNFGKSRLQLQQPALQEERQTMK